MSALLLLPFRVLSPPKFNLQPPRVPNIHRNVVMVGMMACVFFLVAGVVYDVLNQPPNVGAKRLPNGEFEPVLVYEGRLSSQYVFEGLVASAIFTSGGIGIILMLLGFERSKRVFSYTGLGLIVVCFFFMSALIRKKVYYYLK